MGNSKQLVFSGIQPTGNLQLGNYLGAIKNWLSLQSKYECLFCVVDMHALTVNPNPEDLLSQTRAVTAAFIAAGIDPVKNPIFNQSQVMQHAELAWVFNCVARMGWLSRMTQFKDKAGKNAERVSVGLFAYPNLMAADILLYRATHIPVGEDQKQHIELTRDIAQKFDNDYAARIKDLGYGEDWESPEGEEAGLYKGRFFPPVQWIAPPAAMRIMSLRDGTKKMSKSDPSDMSRINLTDDADMIAKKIRKAKTDPMPMPGAMGELKGRPEAENLLNIYASMMDISAEAALRQFAGQEFSGFKQQLIDVLVAKLAPIGDELRRLAQAPDYIDNVLRAGAARARSKAEITMRRVRDIVGFLQ